ncbi:MAG: RNA 2',3'-cyclic phosphodiesterase [Candidatus Korobacteraceae bacterium]
MRLFVALDIEPEIRQRIADFRSQMKAFAPDVRWVGPETFHVTLQFLGETTKLEVIQRALGQVKASAVWLAFRNAGFFPNPKSPRVFWVGIESDQHLQELVNSVAEKLQPLGFKRDAGPYKPHLTLARSGSGRPRPVPGERAAFGLQHLRVKLESLAPLEFGTMTAREFYLYESKLSPAGAKYTKLARYPLE